MSKFFCRNCGEVDGSRVSDSGRCSCNPENPQWKVRVEVDCSWCEKGFRVPWSSRGRNYCSLDCSILARTRNRKGTWKKCLVCGSSVYKPPSHDHYKPYCGGECSLKARRGRPLSEGHRESLRESYRRGRKPTRHTWGRGGFREDLGHYVRSTWEANYARVLLFLDHEYEYEPSGLRCDFLVDGHLAVEVKPDHRWDELPKFFESLSETDITGLVIGNEEYHGLRDMYSGLVDWEYPVGSS